MKKKKCCHCRMPLMIHPATGNCLYCGYGQDPKHNKYVKKKQAKYDKWASKQGHGLHSYGASWEYRRNKTTQGGQK